MTSETKNIICFANSIKHKGRCFAGKELGSRQWIRIVGDYQNDAIKNCEECLSKKCSVSGCDFKTPKLLDIIQINIEQHKPRLHQTENYLFNNQIPWKKVGELNVDDIDFYKDKISTNLWENGQHSKQGFNDMVSTSYKSDFSLLLIQPDFFQIVVENDSYEGKKIRGEFSFNNTLYRLVITDPVFTAKYQDSKIGKYLIINCDEYRLTLSLAQEFKGYFYKLIAGVINIRED